MYLATILDSFTREVIAWNISSRHNKELITETLLNAINKREKSPQIFHSDQGSDNFLQKIATDSNKNKIYQ